MTEIRKERRPETLEMSSDELKRIGEGLLKAAAMTADELAAKKGEDDLFVRIKRNSERLLACDRHEFEPQPDWLSSRPFLNRTVRCSRCGGDMKVFDAMNYLRGFAHASGGDLKALTDAIWPPATPDR
jgi:hypothetical protein